MIIKIAVLVWLVAVSWAGYKETTEAWRRFCDWCEQEENKK